MAVNVNILKGSGDVISTLNTENDQVLLYTNGKYLNDSIIVKFDGDVWNGETSPLKITIYQNNQLSQILKQYFFEYNMTWLKLIQSSSNDGALFVYDTNKVHCYVEGTSGSNGRVYKINDDGSYQHVLITDLIEYGRTYYLVFN